jgi:hypothetical protein
MMKKLRTTAAGLTLFGMAAICLAEDFTNKTINIEHTSSEGVQFSLSLPLMLMNSMRPQIQEMLASAQDEGNPLDFRAIWKSFREKGSHDFAKIHNVDADVKVSTTDSELLIRVKDIEVRILLVTAELMLLAPEYDANAFFSAFENMPAGKDIIRIKGNKTNGRIWIE